MSGTAVDFIRETYRQPFGPSALNRVPNKKVQGTEDQYIAFIWELATNFTNSDEEAAAAVEEMFSDIRRCAEAGVSSRTFEDRLTAKIALRRLLKFLEQPDKKV